MSYTISQVAQMMGVAPSTLRYYDKEGLLPNVKRVNGIRVFEDADFPWLRILNCLKGTGMPIRKIKEYVDLCADGDATLEQRYSIIKDQRQHVLDQIEQLNFYLKELDYKDWYYRTAIAAGTEKAVYHPDPVSGLALDEIPGMGLHHQLMNRRRKISILNEDYVINNGVKIPKLALGTWLIEGQAATEAVKEAIKLGYRHIDTAQAYGNETEVGLGLRESGKDRQAIFVTTKLAAELKDYDSAAKAIDESLTKLGLDYIDLMIIHSPQPWKVVNQSDNRYEKGNLEAYRALEDAYKAGKLRAIGVSNFNQHDLQNILDHADVKPAVDQILAHIANTPFDLIDFCQRNDILVEAYSPVAHGAVLKNSVLVAMAQKYGVSVAQLCIRYDLQLGMLPLPKTANPEHMAQNAAVDFEIDAADMDTLKQVEHIKDYGNDSFFPVFGGKL